MSIDPLNSSEWRELLEMARAQVRNTYQSAGLVPMQSRERDDNLIAIQRYQRWRLPRPGIARLEILDSRREVLQAYELPLRSYSLNRHHLSFSLELEIYSSRSVPCRLIDRTVVLCGVPLWADCAYWAESDSFRLLTVRVQSSNLEGNLEVHHYSSVREQAEAVLTVSPIQGDFSWRELQELRQTDQYREELAQQAIERLQPLVEEYTETEFYRVAAGAPPRSESAPPPKTPRAQLSDLCRTCSYCIGQNFHGKHGTNFFVCAMHPSGHVGNSCPDWD